MLKIQSDHDQQNGPQPTHFQQQREGTLTEEEHSLHFELAVNDPWYVPGIMRELAGGFDALAHLPPSVAVLGSSRAKPGDAAYLAAVETARLLAQAGFGTMDELFEVLVLLQTGKVRHVPVILYDSRYWEGLVSWVRDMMLLSDKIQSRDAGLLLLSDDPQEICNIVLAASQPRSCQEHIRATHALNHLEQVLR